MGTRQRRPTAVLAWVLSLCTLVSLCACTSSDEARPRPERADGVVVRPTDPAFVQRTDGSGIDRMAATTVTDVQRYWSGTFPDVFGSPWRDIDGGFHSVDTTSTGESPPPCSADPREVEGNAYYCQTVDAIVWDRAALLPVLREHYGPTAVVAVLAHEFGHAVQQRADQAERDPLELEAMADCYAGSYLRWVHDGRSQRLRVHKSDLGDALRALVVFRDPTSTGENANPHGTAFDRVTAFHDGFREGPGYCTDRTNRSEQWTEPGERSHDMNSVLRREGMRKFFDELLPQGETLPRPDSSGRGCTADPIAYCPRPGTIAIDRKGLAQRHRDLGDQASATLLASRYALAAVHLRGREAGDGENTARDERTAACLTGAYTTSGVDGPLSPRDLDAAVETVLSDKTISHGLGGTTTLTDFDRVSAFRTGAVGGVHGCGL